MTKKSKVLILGLTLLSVFAATRSWSDNYNLRVDEANCKKGTVVTCYGSTCEAGSSMCIQNPCECKGGNEQ